MTLIPAASLLLVSDRPQRTGSKTAQQKYPAIAIMQITSTPLLDANVASDQILDIESAEPHTILCEQEV